MYIFRSVDAPESLQFEPIQIFKRSNIDCKAVSRQNLFVRCEYKQENEEQLTMNTNTHDGRGVLVQSSKSGKLGGEL